MAENAAAAGPYAVVVVIVAIVLDGLFAHDAPPPPPVGWADFKRNEQGQLAVSLHDTNPLGASILNPKMAEILASLNQQLSEANAARVENGVTIAPAPEAERQLVLIASRAPKLYLQSWPSHVGNGESNYDYYAEMVHPQTGQKYGAQIARQDIVKEYAGLLIGPEALVQKWQFDHMTAKFGADESKWQTEGQWATAQSPLEQQRATLTQAYQEAHKALTALKETKLTLLGSQIGSETTTGEHAPAHAQVMTAAQAKVDAAHKALVTFSTLHPLGDMSQDADDQGHHNEGINPQAAAMIVDKVTADNLAPQQATDPEAWQLAWSKARQAASQQWMKLITLDFNGDGQISKWMPSETAAGSDTRADAAKKFNVGTKLKDLQRDANGQSVARFDVDGDGYREATEWVAAVDAMLGIDRDGNGVIDTASELFNAPNTVFDQRGWNSLKYYDSNKDNEITRADAVWKLLRIWVDMNGDGAAGKMETFTLDMDYAGMSAAELAQLKAGLDAAGQQALTALKNMAVGSIELSTLKLKLADGSTLQAHDDQIKADTLGTAVTQTLAADGITVESVTIFREKPHGANADESVDADTWITFVQDMSVLQELQNGSISAERRTELRTLAQKYGLNPDAADFAQTLKNLAKGGENVGGSGLPTSIKDADVVAGTGLRSQLEAMRIAQANALTVLASDVLSLDPIAKGNQQGSVRSPRNCVAKQFKARRKAPSQGCPRLHHAASTGTAARP